MKSTRCGNLTVEIEGGPCLLSPRLERVMVEIASMSPRAGPSFLILSGGNRDYLQIAGGDGAYIVECRQYDGQTFRHLAAGRSTATDARVKIPTKSGHLRVRAHEKLSCEDVQYLAYAFIKGPCRSRFFAWRDMTAQFA